MKSAALYCAKSTRIKAYFNEFNQWVPCTVQRKFSQAKGLKSGYAYVEFHGHNGWDRFRLQVPIDTIKVEHKLFKHWVPLRALDEVLAVLKKHEQVCQAWVSAKALRADEYPVLAKVWTEDEQES